MFLPVNITMWNVVSNTAPRDLPQWWAYLTSDNIATVSASGYFNIDQSTLISNSTFRIGDLIYCICSDGVAQRQVTALRPNITTSAAPVTPDSIGTDAIQDLAVTNDKIDDEAVSPGKLEAGLRPSHIIKFAGQLTTVGGSATEAFTITGAVGATDRAFLQIVDQGTNTVQDLEAVVTNNTLTVTFDADPGADCVFNYQLIRAVS